MDTNELCWVDQDVSELQHLSDENARLCIDGAEIVLFQGIIVDESTMIVLFLLVWIASQRRYFTSSVNGSEQIPSAFWRVAFKSKDWKYLFSTPKSRPLDTATIASKNKKVTKVTLSLQASLVLENVWKKIECFTISKTKESSQGLKISNQKVWSRSQSKWTKWNKGCAQNSTLWPDGSILLEVFVSP